MKGLYLTSVWLHIIAATVWVGGMMFLVFVLMPVVRKERPREAAALTRLVGRRFQRVGWAALGLLVLTGVGNLALRGIGWSDVLQPRFWQSSFGHVLGMKLVLVGLIGVSSLVHDLVVGPRATEAWKPEAGVPRERAMLLRRRAAWMGRFNLVLALAVVALGIMLVRGTP